MYKLGRAAIIQRIQGLWRSCRGLDYEGVTKSIYKE